MKLKAVFLLLSWLTLLFSFEPFLNLKIGFERRIVSEGREEVIRGVIYYFEGRKLVEVSFPLHQIMYLQKKRLLIYYPEREKAFEIISPLGASLPFFDLFLLPSNKGFFKDKGFIVSEKKRGYVKYSVPSGMDSVVDEVELFLDELNRLRKLVEKKDGYPGMVAEFSNFVEFMGFPYPLKITIKGKKKEEIKFSNPEFNVRLPEWVKNFQIPPGTEIERIKF